MAAERSPDGREEDSSRLKIAVVTVHGTNDSLEAESGAEKWWQSTSPFSQRTTRQLAAKGMDVEVIAFKWSGANSALARERGAIRLAKMLRKSARTYDSLHVVGHSHGGNVADHAAELIGWGRRRRSYLGSLTTVGTPYFKAEIGRWEYIGALFFLVLTVVSIVTLSTITGFSIYHRLKSDDPAYWLMLAVGGIFVLSIVSFRIMMPSAMQGFRRVSRFGSRVDSVEKVFSIWHPHDEAIAFLQRVEHLPIEPFPRRALLNGSRTSSILLSIRLILLIFVFCLIWGGAGMLAPLLDVKWPTDGGESQAVLWIGVAGAVAIFLPVFMLVRFMVGVIPEFLFRNALNKWIAGQVRGMAFGSNTGQRIGNVSTVSHAHASIERILDGDLAERIKKNATEATSTLITEYRWALFNIGGDSQDAVARMSKDALTWESLIHTTYFDHDELADMIVDHIAETAVSKQAGAG
tara:strand:- start:49 stop:1440 length:1392 start_codon:yes stop_codon:yes gene_type:complete